MCVCYRPNEEKVVYFLLFVCMCVCVIDLMRRRSCISCYLYVCVCYRPNEEKVVYFLLFVCVCVL